MRRAALKRQDPERFIEGLHQDTRQLKLLNGADYELKNPSNRIERYDPRQTQMTNNTVNAEDTRTIDRENSQKYDIHRGEDTEGVDKAARTTKYDKAKTDPPDRGRPSRNVLIKFRCRIDERSNYHPGIDMEGALRLQPSSTSEMQIENTEMQIITQHQRVTEEEQASNHRRGEDTEGAVNEKYRNANPMLAIPAEPPDKRTTTFVQREFHPDATRTATATSKMPMQFKRIQRMSKATPKVTIRCSIVRFDQRAHFRERRTATQSVMKQLQFASAHDPRDSSYPDSHHGHSHRSIVRSISKFSEKVGSTYMQNSGGSRLNRNELKHKFRSDHILPPRKNEFWNCRFLSGNYRNAKFEVGISKQELRTYAYNRRHSNSLSGNRPPHHVGPRSCPLR